MQFTVNPSGRPTAVRKPFDFAAAEESLNAALDKVIASYEKVVAAEGICLKCERAIEDCATALESFRTYGVSDVTLSIFNGKNKALDTALNFKSLEKGALESMSVDKQKLVTANYIRALEANEEDVKKTFWEHVKEWWAQFLDWIKDLFTGTAKLAKMVSEVNFDNLDAKQDVKIRGLAEADGTAGAAKLKEINEAMEKIASQGSEFVVMDRGRFDASKAPNFERKEGTISELGWTKAKADKAKEDFLAAVKDPKIKAAWDKIQQEYKAAAANSNPGMVDKLKEKFHDWQAVGKVTKAFNQLAKQVGFTLYYLGKAGMQPVASKGPIDNEGKGEGETK